MEKSNTRQTGVDAGNLTLHVWCIVNVREATGVSMIRQGRLYKAMMITMVRTRYDILLIILVMRGTIKFYFHIYESILCIFVNVTNIMYYWQC